MYQRKIITPGTYTLNKTQLVKGGSTYFQQLSTLIRSALHTVHIQCYIFDDDETGNFVADELIAAANRGVNVYLLADGYASPRLSSSFRERMRANGVNLNHFQPLFKSKKFYFGRRLHHKIAVADGLRALVGGMNITNRYNDMPGKPGWLDMAVQVEGPAAAELERICCSAWNNNSSTKAIPTLNTTTGDEVLTDEDICSVRVRRNDWVKNKNQVWKSYQSLFNNAEEDILIMCSYFLPGWKFRKSMLKALKRGARVRIVVAGTSDVPIAKYAEKFLYNWMLRNGIEVYEYQPTVLHAKLGIRDNKWMTIGSYNVNSISAYASIELNLDIRNRNFVKKVLSSIEDIINNDCVRVGSDFLHRYNIFRKIVYRAAYETVKVIVFLFTFYFRRERQF